MDLKIPYLVHFLGLVLLLVMLKGKNTQSIQVSRTTYFKFDPKLLRLEKGVVCHVSSKTEPT